MCMKSVNINTIFYEGDLACFTGEERYGKILKQIKAVKNQNNEYTIGNLVVYTMFNAMSSSEDKNLSNKYELLWTFGYVKDDKFYNNKIGLQDIDTTKNKVSNSIVSARSFTNQSFNFMLNNYIVSEPGLYYLKVYIRKMDADVSNAEWQVQSINFIEVVF